MFRGMDDSILFFFLILILLFCMPGWFCGRGGYIEEEIGPICR